MLLNLDDLNLKFLLIGALENFNYSKKILILMRLILKKEI